jgi:hypothetical protein
MTTDVEQPDLAEVDAEIAALTARVADGDTEQQGLLAALHLDRYELTDGEAGPSDLHATIAHAEALVAREAWQWTPVLPLLADAHYYLATRCELPDHLTYAVDLLSNQVLVADEWGDDEYLAALRLAEVVWLRLGVQPNQTADLENALEGLLKIRARPDLSAEAAAYSGLLLGHLSAAWSTEQDTDHPRWAEVTDRAIRLLDEAKATTDDPEDRAELAWRTSGLRWRRYVTASDGPLAPADLDATIDDTRTALAADPSDAGSHWRLALALHDRLGRTGDPGDRDGTIEALEQVVRLGDEPDRDVIDAHGMLGELLLARAEATDTRADLEAGISHLVRQRDALPVGDPDRTLTAATLAEAYLARGGGELGPHETVEIILALKELLEHWPAGEEGRELAVLQLALSLLKAAVSTYSWRPEQEEGLTLLRELQETATEPWLRAAVTAMIGSALAMRFMSAMFAGRSGPSRPCRDDLDEAVRAIEEALLDPELEAQLAEWLRPHAGLLLVVRASPAQAWDLNTRIDRAVEPDRAGLPEAARTDLDRAVGYLTGSALEGAERLTLFARMMQLTGRGPTMSDADLDEAIDCVQRLGAEPLSELLTMVSPPAILGALLADRGERTGSTEDADRAIRLLREALAEMHPGQPSRPYTLDLLARLLVDPRNVSAQGRAAAVADAVDALADLVTATEIGGPRRRYALDRLADTVLDSLRLGPDALRSGRVVGLLRGALDTEPDAPPTWRAALATALADRWQATGAATDLEEATGLAVLPAPAAAEPAVRLRVLAGAGLILMRLGALADRPELVRAGLDQIEATRPLADDPAVRDLLSTELLADLRRALDAVDAARRAEGPFAEELLMGIAGLSPAEVARIRPGVLDGARLLTAGATGDRRQVRSAVAAMTDPARSPAPATSADAQRLIARALALVGPRVTGPDVPLLDEAAELLNRGLSGDLADEDARPAYLSVLGRILLERHRLTADPESVRQAIVALERARTAAGETPPSGDGAAGLMALARAYRLRGEDGDGRRAVRTAGAALRAWGRAVLLTDDTAGRLVLARDANERMAEVVGWALDTGDTTSAVLLLEAGRGLLLHAATATASVAAVLARTDHPELAEAWESGKTDVAVRSRALAALASSLAGYHVLGAPEAETISEASWAQGADALVYLVPGSAASPGRALLLRTLRPLEHLELPELRDDVPAVTGYLAAAGPAGSPQWRAALDRLSDWAWTAAISPLLERAQSWGVRREPRVVLVATGALAVVPWHAARTCGPAGPRYACADLVISYAASGRSMIDAVRRPLPVGAKPAFVVDPTGTAGWTAIGARGTRAAFHPDADHLGMGRRPAGPTGTRAEVLALLTAGARSPLQLSTHAAASAVPTESYFVLADGTLTVAEILARAGSRPPEAAGGTVICDACATDLTGDYHDEVLTLSTAFLAAGWSTAIGTRWPVDDQTTALLMFVLHGHLHAGLRPADALRATQLWALDPDRQPPAGMSATLARRAADPGLADPYRWAAFAHHGR